jgi:hypothetical protein
VSCPTSFAPYCVGWARLKNIRREPIKTTSLIIVIWIVEMYQNTPNLLRSKPDLPSCPKYIAVFTYVKRLRVSIGSRWFLFLENCDPFYFDNGHVPWFGASWPFKKYLLSFAALPAGFHDLQWPKFALGECKLLFLLVCPVTLDSLPILS